ncbi:hypothetical protein PTSG_08793 [Salpingoeca rosetta]|uniref:Uncharacterized protein n=1 Tax=Salpingoeca rosetta (strain ATCC 50818 / BSB-021) TaxID=946362 RepID=F2UKQ2_SALR5|nr:uncharacterized protein PTSG_08793 [Salpingoeca rosetta]EGD77701.1 hypothetical protein PTSG_08793 [Salpingoeca rosetta]|eukprot:XP_004990177.1 hypothetical protein PTSG_08793 [Salpingoeca rosetta]
MAGRGGSGGGGGVGVGGMVDDAQSRERMEQQARQERQWMARAVDVSAEARAALIDRLQFICDGGLGGYTQFSRRVFDIQADTAGKNGRPVAVTLERYDERPGSLIRNLVYGGAWSAVASGRVSSRTLVRCFCSKEVETLFGELGFRNVTRRVHESGIVFSYQGVMHCRIFQSIDTKSPSVRPSTYVVDVSLISADAQNYEPLEREFLYFIGQLDPIVALKPVTA